MKNTFYSTTIFILVTIACILKPIADFLKIPGECMILVGLECLKTAKHLMEKKLGIEVKHD